MHACILRVTILILLCYSLLSIKEDKNNQSKYSKINLDNIYDLPHIGTITEKSEPLLTIIDKNSDFKKLYKGV